MDRNGKKPKASAGRDALHAERSDTKASARDALGKGDGGAKGASGKGASSATPARKGGRS